MFSRRKLLELISLVPALSFGSFSANVLAAPIQPQDQEDEFIIVNGWLLKKTDLEAAENL